MKGNNWVARSFFLVFIVLIQSYCFGQISLPKVFGDDMVLQRDRPIPIWGHAKPGTKIVANCAGVSATAKADKEGKWMLHLPKIKAGGPYTLKVYEAENAGVGIELKGILIGEVWLASGQSNMEWQLQQSMNADKEIANANFPKIRFLVVKQDKRLKPQADILAGKWEVCDSVNVKDWSAVAYFFARKIHVDQHVPVGIIQSTWGGTPIESWTSREMLLTSNITKEKTLSNDTLAADLTDFVEDSLNMIKFWNIVYNPQNNTDKAVPAAEYDDSNWAEIVMPNLFRDLGVRDQDGMVWLRKTITLPESFAGKNITINLGHPEMNYSLYFNGEAICKNVWNSNPTHHYTIPARLVNSGKNIIAVRIAMLWDGGGLNPADDIHFTDGATKISLGGKWLYNKDLETPLPRMRNYQYYPAVLYNAMINPLIPFGINGFIWYQGESNAGAAYDYRQLFPMLIKDWRKRWQLGDLPFLYVQLANYKKTKPNPSESEWAELREAQTLTLAHPNTGMASAIDIGEAGDIHPRNKQEVGHRLALIANSMVYKQSILASGPMYKSFQKEGNRIRLSFHYTGKGLKTKDGNEITGFSIAGKDKKFYWAKAILEGNDIIVFADNVPDPVAVRYAWADNPECNLVNSEGLPAVPFRTDDWKLITQR